MTDMIKKVVLEIGEVTIDLTIEQACALREELNKLFGEKRTEYVPYVPYTPAPSWPSTPLYWSTTTSGNAYMLTLSNQTGDGGVA